ncbi:NACHT and WD repeat domain-containing protein [Streptomyces coeruleorubidus]|uniref:NACHT and WD repeat domain-containing protein n=1 Tax=Streptomyces coeruleorubidus TaxID=116188 RepID=UPI0037BBECD0
MGTNVSEWVSTAQTMRYPTLFLLDLCRSGRSARLPFLLQHAGRDTYAWVIAAAASDEEAYDGRFSLATAEVLDELARTGLGTSTTRPYVAFSVVARRIRQRVEAMPGIPQTVVATPLDQGLDDPLLPFFPNPNYREDPLQAAKESVAAAIRPFMDDLLDQGAPDTEHFVDRAGTHFAGRRPQLRKLAAWLDDETSHGLAVVTGSPGVGKSALLGAVVCSAHPRLAEVIPYVRMRLQAQEPDGCPSVVSHMAAVHARQRRLREVIASIADQLRLSEPPHGWNADALISALSNLGERPVIVLDALDEAVDSASLAKDLLLKLATAKYGPKHPRKGQPVCWLLIGMRPWSNLRDLYDLAASHNGLIDLGAVGSAELQADLTAHLASRFADLPAYRPRTARLVRDKLASVVAARLIRETADAPFGAFLVATIFARSLEKLPVAKTEQEASRLANSVPTDLPGLLEMDLASRADPGAMRAVLTALAHAQGDGMPVEVASVLVPLFHQGPVEGLQKLVSECRFYTRTTVDSDGTSLYRLFHQGLADYLCGVSEPGSAEARCSDASAIIDRLLNSGLVGSDALTGSRSWATAAPYVLRHVLSHAATADGEIVKALLEDTDFLIHADPDQVLPYVLGGTARGMTAIYADAFAGRRPSTPEARRFLLTMTVAQGGDATVLRSLRSAMGKESWQPYRVAPLPPSGTVRSLIATVQDGDVVALIADIDNCVALWQVNGTRRRPWPLERRSETVRALASTHMDGRCVVVSGGFAGRLDVWDLEPTEEAARVISVAAPVRKLACAQVGGRHVVVAGGVDGSVHINWLDSGAPIAWITGAHPGPVAAVACTTAEGEPVAVSAGRDGVIKSWHLVSGLPFAPPLDNGAPVGALACARSGSHPLVVGGLDGSIRFWSIADRSSVLGEGHAHAVRAAASTDFGGSAVAITGSNDGDMRVWDVDRWSPITRLSLPGTIKALDAVADTILVGLSREVIALRRQGPRGNALRWRNWGWDCPQQRP